MGMQLQTALADAGVVPRISEVHLHQYLKDGGVCVVVGGKPSNFDDKHRRLPQFRFFDSLDPKSESADLPSNTRVVLVTRFVTHKTQDRLKKQARDRGAFVAPGLVSTGDIRDLINKFLEDQQKAKTAAAFITVKAPTVEPVLVPPPQPLVTVASPINNEPEPEPVVKPARIDTSKNGWLQDFLIHEADLDAANQTAEGRRLYDILKQRGVESTVNSIVAVMYTLRKKVGKDRKSQRTISNAGALKPVPIEDVSPPYDEIMAAAGKPVKKTAKPSNFDAELSAAIQLVRDSQTAMGLVLERLEKIQREETARRGVLDAVRAALEGSND